MISVFMKKLVQRFPAWIKSLSKFQKGVFVVAALGLAIYFFIQGQSTDDTNYDSYVVTRGEISETITISGNVSTSGNTAIFSPSTGIVEELYVKNGDSVVLGQKLAKVKSTATDLDRSAALSSYQSAVASLNTAKQAKITNQSLLEAGRKTVLDASIALNQMNNRLSNSQKNPSTDEQYTTEEIESITSSYTSAKKSFESLEAKYLDSDAVISAAQSSVTANLLAYQATTNGIIKSPLAGTISNLSVDAGDAVVAIAPKDTALASSRPLLRVVSLDNFTIIVQLSEVDVEKVHSGQTATIVFDAIPDQTFTGKVSRVDSVGTKNNAIVTYDTFITMSDLDPRVRPGMSATVTIQRDAKSGVLIVPNIGLTKDNDEIQVQIKTGSSITKKSVGIGIKNSTQSEVISGLTEGDIILLPKAK